MNYTLDVIVLSVMFVNALRVGIKGLVAEVLGLAAVIGGLLAAAIFTGPVNQALLKVMPATTLQGLVIFLLIFLVVYIIFKVIENKIHDFLENLEIDKADNILGFFLGLAEAVVLILIVSYILLSVTLFDVSGFYETSNCGRIIRAVLLWVMNLQGA